MSDLQAPPQHSADGNWWWTGTEWVPAQRLARELGSVATPPVEAQPQPEPAPDPVPQTQLPVFEILPAGVPEAAKRGGLRSALAGSAAAVVLIGAGAAYGVGHYLGGGGQQPEDVLPANAVAVAKVDLDPSLSQKTALLRLSRAFPQLHVTGADSLKDDVLRAMLSSGSMSYDRDVKPWLGDRAAVAAVPGEHGIEPVAAVQYTDKDKAKRTLLAASARAATSTDPFFFAFSGDYAVIAETQAAADRYAATSTHLSDNASYSKAVDSLGGDQIAVAWADVKGIYRAMPAAQRKTNPFLANVKAAPTGSFVVGIHAAPKYLELQGRALGTVDTLAGRAKTANLIASFPNDTAAAVEATKLGAAMTSAFRALPPALAQTTAGFGLKLPGDLATLLGTDTAIGVLGDVHAPTFIAHVKTKEPAKAAALLRRVAAQGAAPPFTVRRDVTGYVLTTDPHARTTGRLGSTPSYVRAVPDAKTAGMIAYVDLSRLPMPQAKGLDAFGVTVDATGAVRIRLTIR